jgi:hypothetical protein
MVAKNSALHALCIAQAVESLGKAFDRKFIDGQLIHSGVIV